MTNINLKRADFSCRIGWKILYFTYQGDSIINAHIQKDEMNPITNFVFFWIFRRVRIDMQSFYNEEPDTNRVSTWPSQNKCLIFSVFPFNGSKQ